MAKQRRILGGIYAIPLPDKTFAFGRLYYEQLAIFKGRSTDMNNIPDFEIDFFVGVFNEFLTDGEWPRVGKIPFTEDESIWTPPQFIEEIGRPGNYSIYYKGEMRKATKKECLGLEQCSVWGRNHVVDRLMGDNSWTKICT